MALYMHQVQPFVSKDSHASRQTVSMQLLDDTAEQSWRDIAWVMLNQHDLDPATVEDALQGVFRTIWADNVAIMAAEHIVESVLDRPRNKGVLVGPTNL